MTDLAEYIQATVLMDTHEHMTHERDFLETGADILQNLFGGYIESDLVSAGASNAAIERLQNPGDLAERWSGIKDAWAFCQHTSYGEATCNIARLVYGMDEINLATLEAAVPRNAELCQPGGRLKLLKEVAKLDHIQVDDFVWACLPDASGLDFFLYDLSWENFSNGNIKGAELREETGVEVTDLASLRAAMAGLFSKYGDCAIAVKSQHAYARTLAWQERDDADAETVLQKVLRGVDISPAEMLCLGDWNLARGIELAIEYNLPIKIHTGYLAGNDRFHDPDRTRPSHLVPLFHKYGAARFVLMHTAYPYIGEILAVAKHFPNVFLDMCWAWSIDSLEAANFLRRMIHTVPINKTFAFGGDVFAPAQTVGYAAQARAWLNRALQAEIDEGLLTEAQAIQIATRLMRANQIDCFDLDGARAAIQARHAAMAAASGG
jgi:predicted TIM-barrel fold metal-dependent hydrolase